MEHQGKTSKKTLKGQILLVTAFLACPCHLIIAVPALVAGGSVLGLFLQKHFALILALLSAYFITALILGLKWAGNKERARS